MLSVRRSLLMNLLCEQTYNQSEKKKEKNFKKLTADKFSFEVKRTTGNLTNNSISKWVGFY